MTDTIQHLVRQCDPQNLFSILVNSHLQALAAWGKTIPALDIKNVNAIIFCGMGGSAISGNLAINFLRDELRLPFIVNRSYSLPSWAGKETLVIASSYSGNTEETVAAFKEAHEKNCRIACITNGGILQELAENRGIPTFSLEAGLQPRYALYSSFFTLLKILESLGFIPAQSSCVDACVSLMKESAGIYQNGGPPWDIATKLRDSIVAVYSAEGINDAVGMRLKAQLNENSKALAFHAAMSEANHNEIVGWEGLKASGGKFSVVMLADPDYNPGLRMQIDAACEVMAKEVLPILQLHSTKKTHKERLIDMMYLSDWISYFLALIGGKNPARIDNIHRIKDFLKAHRGKENL